MGSDESNSNSKKDESLQKKPKKEIKFQNEFLKSKRINTLNKSIIDDLISPQNQPKNENNDNINDINFNGISGGNNSTGNEIEKLTKDLDCLSVDDRLQNKNKINDINKRKNKRIDIKNMSNKIQKEKNINIGIDRKNYETINNPMMSTSKNFYHKRIKYDKNKKEEDEKEEKKMSTNNANDENKVSNIKSISENFQINNDIQNKKSMGFKKRNNQKNYNNLGENYNTINNENVINPLIKSQNLEFKRDEDRSRKKVNVNMEKNLNINININIDNDINNNININSEIKQNEKNEEDDFDSNLKINNIIKSKNSFKKSVNVEIKTNQIKEDDNEMPKRRMMRYNSYSNMTLNNNIPKKVFLFDNPNIFDSFLIILNNIVFMTKYFEKRQKIEAFIKKRELNNQYCLFGILYYINKYLWDKRPEDIISKKKLSSMYKSFLDCYIKLYCKNTNPKLYLYDIDNLEIIISFIFKRINEEQTEEKNEQALKQDKIQKNEKSLNDGKKPFKDKQLYDYMQNYMKTHKSIIFDNYTGFCLIKESCSNCYEKAIRYKNNYNSKIDYTDFNYISFDINACNKEYFNYQKNRAYSYNLNIYQSNNSFTQFNNFNLNIYLMMEQKFQCYRNLICDVCHVNSKEILKQFLILPKILTIILNNNDGNFEINDEINLSKYACIPGNYNYQLISMLCKYKEGSYITYCLNHRDSNWYYYTSEERLVHKVRYLDINAIPYVLVYQNIETIEFKYTPINRKKGYHFKFLDGRPQITLYFENNANIKDAKKEIQRNHEDIKNPVLLFNGAKLKDNEKLSEISFDLINKAILVIIA